VKKVLIITYYWPPSGGAGVQRWLKFVKYLKQFGWEPIVYTAQNPESPIIDESFFKDIPEGITILKQPIWEPYQLYKKLIGQKKEERVVSGFLQESGKKGLAQKLSLWLRGNVFIPDARKFWIKPSIKFLNSWLKENPVDAIVSTGPPHSMHLIARGIKKKTGLPWLADFRDPWVNIDFASDLAMSNYARNKNISLEKAVLQEADRIVVVSDFMAEEFQSKTEKPVSIITNGYDPDDFNIAPELLRKDAYFSIVHTGSLNDRRNHPALWKAISDLRAKTPEFKSDFRLRLIGKNDISVKSSISAGGLDDCTEFIDYLPHQEIIAEQKSASVLLLSINNYGASESGFFSPKATLTGKLFEYLAAGRPILMVGPKDGQAANVVSSNQSNRVVDFGNQAEIEKAVLELYESRNSLNTHVTDEQFSRIELTRKLTELLSHL
jgi:glycosyltransferase involved in cell wall biosynthesis